MGPGRPQYHILALLETRPLLGAESAIGTELQETNVRVEPAGAFAQRPDVRVVAGQLVEIAAEIREIPLSSAVKIAQALSIDLAWLLIGVSRDSVAARDPRLAEMLVWLANEWEAHNEHGRERLQRRFVAAFPEWGPGPEET